MVIFSKSDQMQIIEGINTITTLRKIIMDDVNFVANLFLKTFKPFIVIFISSIQDGNFSR